jgi:hypothetical protein
MKNRRYKKVKSADWQQPVKRGYLQACCDCCLVHRVDFRIYKGRVQFRCWRADRLTAKLRKEQRVVCRTNQKDKP